VAAYGPALIVLTLPLEFPAKYMGQPLVRWIMVLVGAALAYLVFTGRRRLAIPRQASVVWLGAFVAVSTVSWVVTRSPSSYKAFADVALYPIFGVMVMNLLLDERDHRRAWNAFLVSGLCGAAGAACAVVVPLTWSRSGLALFIISVVFAAAVAAERQRSIALALALLFVFAFSTVVNPATRLRAVDAYNTFVSFAGVTGLQVSTPKAPSEGGDTVLADNRRYMVEAGVRMFRDHPLLGVGYGGYQNQLSTTYKRFIPPNLPNPDVASHTGFVTIASEMGILGLLLFLGFLVQLAREAFRAR